MNKKIFFIIGGTLSLILFIGSITETEPNIIFGYSINVWIVRAFWLLNTFVIFKAYGKIKETEQIKKP